MNVEARPSTTTGVLGSSTLFTILWIGLIAGTLDIADNLIFNQLRGINPKMVFQYMASRLIGAKSFRLGATSIVLGVLLHYTIACFWAAVFYAISRKLAVLLRRPVWSGVIYGIAVYLIMNFIVLPLSGVRHPSSAMTISSRINGVLAVVLFIGLTISLLMRRNSKIRNPAGILDR
jgi:hypothetical protein